MKKQVSNIQMDAFLYFLMHACFVGIVVNNMFLVAKQSTPFSVLLAIIMGLIPLLLFLFIINYRKDCSIIELNLELFGKKIGFIINLLLLIFTTGFGVIVFYNLCNFISSQFLYRTPILMIGITFALGMWYMISKGLPTFARVVIILLYIDFVLYILSFLGLVGQVDVGNLLPLMEDGSQPIVDGSLHFFTYSVLPIFLLTIIPKNSIRNHQKFNRHIIVSYVITSILLFIIITFTLSILGIELCQIYQFPEFHILKRVSILGFITRVENTLSVQWIFDMLIVAAFSLFFVLDGIKRLWKNFPEKIEPTLRTILVFIIFLIAMILFPNNTDAYQVLSKIFPFFSIFFFFLLPLVIFFRIKIQEKKSSIKTMKKSDLF